MVLDGIAFIFLSTYLQTFLSIYQSGLPGPGEVPGAGGEPFDPRQGSSPRRVSRANRPTTEVVKGVVGRLRVL